MNIISNILKYRSTFTIALGTMVSAMMLDILKGFTEDLVMPTVNPAIDNINKKLNLNDFEIHYGPFHFYLGKFIKRFVQFLVMLILISYFAERV